LGNFAAHEDFSDTVWGGGCGGVFWEGEREGFSEEGRRGLDYFVAD
jgi:hypothetical protein